MAEPDHGNCESRGWWSQSEGKLEKSVFCQVSSGSSMIGRCFCRKRGAVPNLVQHGTKRSHRELRVHCSRAASWWFSRVSGALMTMTSPLGETKSQAVHEKFVSPIGKAVSRSGCQILTFCTFPQGPEAPNPKMLNQKSLNELWGPSKGKG